MNNNNNNVVLVLLMMIMYITTVLVDGIHATNNLISNIIEEDSNKNNNNNAAGYVNDNDVNNFSDNNNDGFGGDGDDDVVKADDDTNCHLKCQNQAKCTMHEVTKEYYCDCVKTESGGFQGNKCQISYLDCSDGDKRSWRCQNGGHCLTADDPTDPTKHDYKFTCHCLDWYTGRQCQDKIEKPTDSAIYDKSKYYNDGKDYGTAVLSNNKSSQSQSKPVIIFGLIMYCVVVGALFFMGGYFTGKRGMVSASSAKEALESTSTSSSPDTDGNPLEEDQDNFVNVVQDINIDEPPSEIFNKLTTIT